LRRHAIPFWDRAPGRVAGLIPATRTANHGADAEMPYLWRLGGERDRAG
jgi:hypothetical protein